MTVGTEVTAGAASQNVTLQTTTSGNITLTGTVSAADDTVTMTSIGSINGAGLVTASTLDLDAQTGIGNTIGLQTAIDNLEADTVTGGVTLTESDGLTSADVSTTGASSSINLTTGNGGTTWTDIDTRGLASNITLDSGTGTTILSAVDTSDGAITVTSDGATTVTYAEAVGAGRDISIINSLGDMSLLLAIAEDDTITLESTAGAITDGDASDALNIRAAETLIITALNDIGASADPIEIDVTNLTPSSTGGGDIYINTPAAGYNLSAAAPLAASVVLTTNKTVSITNLNVIGGNNLIRITSTEGNIEVGTVSSETSITLSGVLISGYSTGSNLTAPTATLTSNTAVGTRDNTINVNVSGALNVIANGHVGFFSVCMSGATTPQVTNNSGWFALFNNDFIKTGQTSTFGLIDNVITDKFQYEEDLEDLKEALSTVVFVVITDEVTFDGMGLIDTYNITLENPYDFSKGQYLL